MLNFFKVGSTREATESNKKPFKGNYLVITYTGH